MKVWEYLSRREISHLEMSWDGSAAPRRGEGFACSPGGAWPYLASMQGQCPALGPHSATCDALPELWGGLSGGFGSLAVGGRVGQGLAGLSRRKARGGLTWGCPARRTAAGASRLPVGTGDAARSLLLACLKKEERHSWVITCPCPTLCRGLLAPQNPAPAPCLGPSSACAGVQRECTCGW